MGNTKDKEAKLKMTQNYIDEPVGFPPNFEASIVCDGEFGGLKTMETIDMLPREKNFDVLPPENVLRIMFQYLTPRELLNVMLSCRLIHLVSSSPLFWKEYYFSFFGEKKTEHTEERINWKKQFFKRFYFKSEYYFTRKKYIPVPISKEIIFGEYRRSRTYSSFFVVDTKLPVNNFFESVGFKSYDPPRRSLRSILFAGVDDRSIIRLYTEIMDIEDGKDGDIDQINPIDNCGVFFCFSLTDRKTYKEMIKFMNHKTVKQSMSRNYCSPILIGIQFDDEKRREVSSKEVTEYIRNHNSPKKKKKKDKNFNKFFSYVEVIYNPEKKIFQNGLLSICLMIDSIKLCRRNNLQFSGPKIERPIAPLDPIPLICSIIEDSPLLGDLTEIEREELRIKAGFYEDVKEIRFELKRDRFQFVGKLKKKE